MKGHVHAIKTMDDQNYHLARNQLAEKEGGTFDQIQIRKKY